MCMFLACHCAHSELIRRALGRKYFQIWALHADQIKMIALLWLLLGRVVWRGHYAATRAQVWSHFSVSGSPSWFPFSGTDLVPPIGSGMYENIRFSNIGSLFRESKWYPQSGTSFKLDVCVFCVRCAWVTGSVMH